MTTSAADVGRVGEGATVAYLKNKGFTVTSWNTQGPGATDIEAVAGQKGLLVQVKSAVSPNSPCSISDLEQQAIASRATRKGYEAWEARVQLDASLRPMGEPSWRKLN